MIFIEHLPTYLNRFNKYYRERPLPANIVKRSADLAGPASSRSVTSEGGREEASQLLPVFQVQPYE